MNKIILVLFLTALILNISCDKSPTYSQNINPTANTEPIASFTINPISGTIQTVFTFDASSSTDNEDSISVLQFRWDRKGDGFWDTFFSTTKTTTYQYNTIGTYTVKLEVKDSGGLVDTTTLSVIVTLPSTGTVTDIDGNMYNTIQIGDKWWMAENLNVTHYRNGDIIPHVPNNETWSNSTTGAYCNYNNDTNNAMTYGRLYNWYALNDSRNIAPTGWHVSTDAEWQTLVDYFGGDYYAGNKLKESGTTHWGVTQNQVTNESGFTALPGGQRYGYGGVYQNIEEIGSFFTSTESSDGQAWNWQLFSGRGEARHNNMDKEMGHSVRCVKD